MPCTKKQPSRGIIRTTEIIPHDGTTQSIDSASRRVTRNLCFVIYSGIQTRMKMRRDVVAINHVYFWSQSAKFTASEKLVRSRLFGDSQVFPAHKGGFWVSSSDKETPSGGKEKGIVD